MSEAKTPVGSMALRVLSQPSMPGTSCGSLLAEVRDSLARYRRPPNSMTRRSRSSRKAPRPGLNGEVHTHVPARHRVGQRGLVARAEQLEHIQRRVVAGLLHVADDLLERLHGIHRNHELVLQEALGTVAAVPLADEIQRLVELRGGS